MTLKEFKKQFYPSHEVIERMALNDFIWSYLDLDDRRINATAICNGLWKAGVRRLEDLRAISEDEIRCHVRLGEKRIGLIMELKEVLDKFEV